MKKISNQEIEAGENDIDFAFSESNIPRWWNNSIRLEEMFRQACENHNRIVERMERVERILNDE